MNEFDPFDTELTDLLRTERRKGSRYEESIEPERQALLSCLYDHIVALSADEIEHLTVDTLLHPEVYTTEELSQMLDAVMRVDMDRYQFAHIRRGEMLVEGTGVIEENVDENESRYIPLEGDEKVFGEVADYAVIPFYSAEMFRRIEQGAFDDDSTETPYQPEATLCVVLDNVQIRDVTGDMRTLGRVFVPLSHRNIAFSMVRESNAEVDTQPSVLRTLADTTVIERYTQAENDLRFNTSSEKRQRRRRHEYVREFTEVIDSVLPDTQHPPRILRLSALGQTIDLEEVSLGDETVIFEGVNIVQQQDGWRVVYEVSQIRRDKPDSYRIVRVFPETIERAERI